MSKLEEDWANEKVRLFLPAMVRKRRQNIEGIIQEIERSSSKFKQLDEKNSEDVKRIESIVFKLYPLTHPRTAREYARTSIRVWRMKNKQ